MFLGIDTSNYTTSLALLSSEDKVLANYKKLLPVKDGSIGLRQSDAVFHHVQQLPELFMRCQEEFGNISDKIKGVGVSVRPRDLDDSYMPCFTVGRSFADSIGALVGIKPRYFSHQCGHVAAALYSADRMDLIGKQFVAFHFSGGTSEAVLCEHDDKHVISTTQVAGSLDLKAGQVIDRVGNMLGLPFPAGPALDTLSVKSKREFKVKPTMKGYDTCMSGIENQCRSMLEKGELPEDIAKFAICSVCAVVDKMSEDCIERFGDLPIIYAGGVMSNSYISKFISDKHHGFFAQPQFSSDNAVGVAVLAAYRSGIID